MNLEGSAVKGPRLDTSVRREWQWFPIGERNWPGARLVLVPSATSRRSRQIFLFPFLLHRLKRLAISCTRSLVSNRGLEVTGCCCSHTGFPQAAGPATRYGST